MFEESVETTLSQMEMDRTMVQVVDTKMEPLSLGEKVKVFETRLEPPAMVEGNVVSTLAQMKMKRPMAKVVYTKMEPLAMVEALELDELPGKWMGSQERCLEPQWRMGSDSWSG